MSTESLFIDVPSKVHKSCPFDISVSQRGFGKTYSVLKHFTHGGCKKKFMLMRRTQDELDLLMDADGVESPSNPFKAINEDTGTHISIKRVNKKMGAICEHEYVTDEETHITKMIYGKVIGYACSLSTIANLRGMDFSDVDTLCYDEFIPEKHIKKIANEGEAFLNAYETINRNRELKGDEPVRVFLLANANDIVSPILQVLGLSTIVERMQRNGTEHMYLDERGIALHLYKSQGKKFTSEKAKTQLYKATRGTRFSEMALENKFAYNDMSLVRYEQLSGYSPVCALDDAYIYKKKGERRIYITYSPTQKVPIFHSQVEQEVRLFMQTYGLEVYNCFLRSQVSFETYDLKSKVLDVIL